MNPLGWSCCEVWMLLLGMIVGVGYVIYGLVELQG